MKCIKHLAPYDLLRSCLVMLAVLGYSSRVFSIPLTTLMHNLGTMDLDPKVVINEISDEGDYIKLSGTAPDKESAFDVGRKLLYSANFKSLNLVDVIPYWSNQKLIIIMKKGKISPKGFAYVEIISPPARQKISNKTIEFEGRCSRDGSEVILEGDVMAKAMCTEGKWKVTTPNPNLSQLGIISVTASQVMINQDVVKDFRSFLTEEEE